jgi:hypothetical protein
MPWDDDDDAIAAARPDQLAELAMFRAGRMRELEEANNHFRSDSWRTSSVPSLG